MAKEKSSKKRETRYRNWWFVLYPESAPEDWKQRIDDLHIQYAISPLHDKDRNPDGELKKPHWHVILCYENVKTYEQIKEFTDSLNAPIPQAVNGLVGTVRYLIHKDNPDKYQYNKAEIIAGGGFDVAELLDRSPSDKRAIVKEIYEFIKTQDITEFYELTDYAFENNADWFEILMDGHTMVFDAVIKSRRHSNKLQQERDERKQAEAAERLKALREEQGIKVDEATGEVIEDTAVQSDTGTD
jgi:hypothetical protein